MTDLNLQRFFAPRRVAIVGASTDLSKFGGRCFKQLREFGFDGEIYPINPKLNEIDGLRCYPDIAALPETPDHVCIIIPAKGIPEVFAQCGARGVPFATVFSSGFSEGGAVSGRDAQADLLAHARKAGLRFMGPNCNGLINYIDGVALTSTATINGPRRPKGDIAVLGHSGGLAQVNVMYRAQMAGLGISYQVSCGNDADLDILDYADFMVDDPQTRVILITAETLKDGTKLRRLAARAVAAGKPIVMMKLGRSAAGQQAAVSHTGALAGSDAVADDVLRQLGILRVNDCHEMIEAAMLLRQSPRVSGRRLAAVSISGGNLVHLADQGPLQGLSFPELSDSTKAQLSALIPNYGQAANPTDVTSAAIGAPHIFSGVLAAIAEDPAIDMVLPVLTLHSRELIETTATALQACPKPSALIWSGSCTDDPTLTPEVLIARGIPVYRDIAPAMKAINQAASFDAFARAERPSVTSVTIEPKIAQAMAALPRLPTEIQSKTFLRLAGIPVPRGIFAATPAAAGIAATELGGRCVVKLVSPDISHKTEVGGVHLGITGAAAAIQAAAEIMANCARLAPNADIEGVLVEEMSSVGVEMILGLSKDPVLGAVMTVGLGGVQAEMIADVAHRLLPIDRVEAEAMLRQLRGWPLLDGFRGRPKADVQALTAMMVALSDLAVATQSDWDALDLNPVIVQGEGGGVMACDALLVRP